MKTFRIVMIVLGAACFAMAALGDTHELIAPMNQAYLGMAFFVLSFFPG